MKFKVGDCIVVVYQGHPRTNKAGVIVEACETEKVYVIRFEDKDDKWDMQDRYFEYSEIHNSPLMKALR